MGLIDAACRLAASDPRWALFIAGMLIAALLGVLWAWAEEWGRPS
jgi:ABC-type uncharacterized transport system permease subunit